MAKTPFALVTVTAVVVGLALPAVANGQAIPRHGTTSSGSSGSTSSGSSGGSSGGVSGGGSSGVSQPPAVPAPSRGSNAGSDPVTSGTYSRVSRNPAPAAPVPGGIARPAVTAPVNASGGDRRAGLGADDSAQQFSSANNRPRGNNPITGFAAPRASFPAGGGGIGNGSDFVSNPFWGPWGSWYPWYGGGFGWGFGYYGYNPWYYGATCWSWGRWGAWYDPFGYCWNPYWGAPTTYVEIAGTSHRSSGKVEPETGKLRIVTSPKTASVYVDDALAGTVDQFDGLNDHLELDRGRHVVSIKADGYETAAQEVVVEGGRTVTVRISLKKIK